ncbi:protein BatD [Hyunsoonleella flava]|uniref:Protein BatD n=1 Tax=Hyunsoonleella flava TaxID=2527939 RepID=A0A4Q9FD67_9FLAO|nr:BatD family protein [Hyunsoonleella flava]TBN02436.1 protein BatD [Hyunsoonleella flava]
MKAFKNITIFLIILATSVAAGQVKFEAKVSKKKLGVNERLRVDFEMNKDGDNFNPPSFNGFTVIGGPNQSVSNSWINGVRTYKKTYSYFLAPKKRGVFNIGQATIEIEGEIYKTTPIKVEITAAIDKPKNPNDPSYVASNNIHLVAEVSNSTPYLNEAITVVYKLYVAPTTGVDNWREIDIPRYDDFWSQNIDTQGQRVQNGTYQGEDYRYLVLRKTVLYPQRTGKLNIEPLTLNVSVQVPTNRRDIFGSRLMTRVSRTVSAGNRTINVKPLPEAGKPADFSGAVGDFSFKVTTSKTELDATESLQAKVEVRGKGNLKLFNLPKMNLPSSLEVYEPEHKENVSTTSRGMQGSISDNYTIVPQYKGKYPIPSISFSYFDLKTESYKRLSSEEIIIDVLDGPINNASNASNNTTNVVKQQIKTASNQFAFIKTKTDFTPKKKEYFFKTKLFWSLLLGPFLVIPLAIVVRRKKATRDADVVGNKRRKADRLARKYLKGAKRELGKKEAFYEALEKALHNYLKAKLHIETSELSKDRIQSLLIERGVETDVVTDFIAIFENCELARYTPITNVTMQEDYQKAAKTISLIDKQAR